MATKMADAEHQSGDEADVPPLEDMSHLLKTLPRLRTEDENMGMEKKTCNQFLEVSDVPQQDLTAQRIEKLLGKEDKRIKEAHKEHSKEATCRPEKKSASNFGGFKKGFLINKQGDSTAKETQANRTSSKDKIKELKPRPKLQNENPLMFPEVQSALAEQMPLLASKDWITEDFLSKIQQNPKLFKQLQDPKYSRAIAALQSNPKEAMIEFQNDPELNEFFQQFCSIMGEHFTALSDKKDASRSGNLQPPIKEAASKSVITKSAQSLQDESKMEAILADPDIQIILAKPKIQQLISAMRIDPKDGQRILATFESKEHRDIQRLVEVGLLGVSRS